jgi:hypothetical protein
MQRARDCHRKYGDACPHLERHSKKWVAPLGTVPMERAEAQRVTRPLEPREPKHEHSV